MSAMLRQLLQDTDNNMQGVDIEILDMTLDSRQVTPGCLFVALKGAQIDARQYIAGALKSKAAAVLYDDSDQPTIDQALLDSGKVIAVRGLSQALSKIAAGFYDHPSRKMDVIGITGTNGKTTIAYYLAQMLENMGRPAAVMGTLGAGKLDKIEATGMTTVDAIQTQKILAQMVKIGVKALCMEVSSHGLEQARVAGIEFNHVVLSNLSQDHLDYHRTMQDYAAAKSRLFKEYAYDAAIINQDDGLGAELIAQLNDKVITYGLEDGALLASDIKLTPDGIAFNVTYADEKVAFKNGLIGKFNIYNMLAVLGVGLAMDYSLSDLVKALAVCHSAPGRMERINVNAKQAVVVVDYAHTPDALNKALLACKAHCEGMLNVVFGCGGDRDKGKRADMGRIAEELADQVFITDDNPRSEAPAQITKDIIKGMTQPAWVVHDRAQAISAAITGAAHRDWVLIAGKGHETTQVYADRTLELDDRVLARQALERLAA